MKILQIFNQYRERGGEEKSVQRIYEHVASRHDIQKCWFNSADWDGPEGQPVWRQSLLIGKNPEALNRIRAESEKMGAEVWILHNVIPVVSLGIYELALKMGVPIVQYLHNFRPFSVSGSLWARNDFCLGGLKKNFLPEVLAGSWQGSRLRTAVLAWHLVRLHRSGNLEAVSRWVGISDFVAQTFSDSGVPSEKIVSLKHSWDASNLVETQLNLDYYLFLGRLVSEKGIECLIDAWRILDQELGSKTPKLIIGGLGAESKLVEEAASSIDAIKYLGYVDGDQKDELIKNCRAMLAPSTWWEPLGLVTYEAYDHGKAIIAARSGGLTETVIHGETGFIHDPGEPKKLAEAVIMMEKLSSEEQISLGLRGHEWLIENTGPENWKNSFDEILVAAVGEKGNQLEG